MITLQLDPEKGRALAGALKAVMPHMGMDDFLPVLTTIQMKVVMESKDEGAKASIILTATDRFTAAKATVHGIEVAEGQEEEYNVYLDKQQIALVQFYLRSSITHWITLDEGSVDLGDGVLRFRSTGYDHNQGKHVWQFPTVEKIIEELAEKATKVKGVQPVVLSVSPDKMAKFTASFRGRKNMSLHFKPSDEGGTKGWVVTRDYDDDFQFTGVIMPRRRLD